ncbi:glycine-rich domain-containing protein [Gordonia sputi]|uniref:glycine-rich domain-containing protein n=1 Tax=Gordonia sputi TaxID=36823 RepID=UPI0036C25049
MWSPDGPSATVGTRQGWTIDGPDPIATESKLGWWAVPQATVRDDGAAQDVAIVRPKLARAISGAGGDRLYMGTDPTQDFELRIPVRDNAAAQGLATVLPRVTVRDSGIAAGAALLGVAGRLTDGVAGDLTAAKAATPARDNSASNDRLIALRANQSARDAGSVGDSATATFSAVSATTATITATGTYTIPVWCRYIDVVLLGAGGGGNGGDTGTGQAGNGGTGGAWTTITLQRGVDIPWTATAITITIGAGGSGGAKGSGNNGGTGGATTATVAGVGSSSAAGGAGGNGTGGGQTGASPGNTTYLGTTYTGGAAASGNGTAGNAPGGGAAGGNGGIFGGGSAGGTGARGQAWITARQ